MGKKINLGAIVSISSLSKEAQEDALFKDICQDIDTIITNAAKMGETSTVIRIADELLPIVERLIQEYEEFDAKEEMFTISDTFSGGYESPHIVFDWSN